MSAQVLAEDNLKYQLNGITQSIKNDQFKLKANQSALIKNDLQLRQIEAVMILNRLFNK